MPDRRIGRLARARRLVACV